jgi:hypothetical protein
MSEISHVRIAVPTQAMLNRVLREGGAQLFPQWLYAEPAQDARIVWWGLRDAPVEMLEIPDDPARAGLFPRPFDDWTEAPRGLVLATLDMQRAIADLAPALPGEWRDAGEDAVLGARCRRLQLDRSVLVWPSPRPRATSPPAWPASARARWRWRWTAAPHPVAR